MDRFFFSHEASIPHQIRHHLSFFIKPNKAFDQRRLEAISLASVNDDFDVDDKRPFVSIREQKYDAAEGKLNLYKSAASALMPPRAAFERIERYNAPIAREEVWQAMTPEQQLDAREIRAAIAEGPLREYGVTWETLRVVRVVGRDEDSLALVHVGKGIDIGNPHDFRDPARSHQAVMSTENDRLFQVRIGDTTYDTRQGMTTSAYRARWDEVTRVLHLPDPDFIREMGDTPYSNYIMLTGEPLNDEGKIQAENRKERTTYPPDANYGHLLVCPAVLFGTLEK